jgi:hypothetical protein
MNTRKAAGRGTVMLLLYGALAAPVAWAAEDPRSRGEAYGTSSSTVHTIQAYDFLPQSGAGTNLISNNFASRGCSSTCVLIAPVMIPSGAAIHEFELEACDTDPAAQVTATLFRQNALEGTIPTLATVSTAAGNSCGFFHVALAPHTVNNHTGTYMVAIVINGTTIATRFQAVRLFYRLQVSPPPATATFPNDVPTTHPIFRFVEALAAAGITGGCGAGSYCPDSPLTRGQMAVFLSTALGLHFPN